MLKRTLLIVFILLTSFSFIPLSLLDWDTYPNNLRVHQGVMDLAGWEEEQHTRIKLDGTWEFYWNRLLTPEDFRRTAQDQSRLPAPAYMAVPSTWNGKVIDGQPLSAYGYATYRMVLKNLPADGVYAIKKTNIRFSSTVYANGQKLFADGTPAEAAANYRAGNLPQIGFFSAEQGDVEIIVQVANYDYINAGIPVSLYFGGQAAMMDFQQKTMTQEFSTFAILSALSLIFIICFLTAAYYQRKDFTLLIFAAVCAIFAVYNGLIGERPLYMYIPGASFEVLYKVKDICSLLCLIILTVFFYQLQKNIISQKFAQILTLVLGCYLLMVVFLPIRIYVSWHPFIILLYELMLVWLLVRIAILYGKSAEKDRLKLLLLFMAILCINLYSLDVILFAYSLKESLWLGQLYIVFFNIILIFLIAVRFFEAYHTINEMKNQLLQMDKLKDDFLSKTSHELKTPLNAIVSITDTLLKGVEGPVTEKQAQNLAIVKDSGRRLTHLVNELLDYSKMKHGDVTLTKSAIHLQAVVDSVIGIHSFLLEGKQIKLINRIAVDIEVYADSNRLIQILHNLIGNAIKFTERGVVDVSASTVGEMVEVRVGDTGIGIPASMQERIFQAFEQVDGTDTKSQGGTGLGLSITKKLVELHGGEIRVLSTPGQGSVFIFTISKAPVPGSFAERTEVSVREEEQAPRQLRLSHAEYPLYIQGTTEETVLVVDDDYANLQSMINLLKLEGYSTVVVNRGQLALDVLAQREFFLVVLDIMMPDMSGYEVLKKVRERFSPFELPVLMLTAKNRGNDIILSMENGANDFVGKPFESEELLARVRSLTRLKASVRHAKNAEIAFLRSQIKPHFLFNALNSIAALCMDEPLKAEELTLQLSQYLRSSFDFKQLDSLTSLRNELELVDAYLNIEKARFGDRLQVDFEVDAHLDVRIPPLILQPLVENAIRHGLMSNVRGGTVKIAVTMKADNLVHFVVEDDGCGISEKRLRQLMEKGGEKKGVGLWNISQRIKLLYGKDLHMDSKEGIGTKISFDIPAQPFKQMGG